MSTALKKRGAPSKRTPEMVQTIIDAISEGRKDPDACRLAGIGVTTFHKWRRSDSELDAAIVKAKALRRSRKPATPWPRSPSPNPDGRPSKRTPEMVASIVSRLEEGLPIKTTCELVGIDTSTFYEWRRLHETFRVTVNAAIARASGVIVRSVRRSVVGITCPRCDGEGSEQGFDKEGRKVEYKCPACSGTTFSVRPDGRLGIMLLERRNPEDWAKKAEVKVTGGVDVRVAHVHMSLDGIKPEQLAELAWGGALEADVIDAE